MQESQDPVEAFHQLSLKLRASREPHVIATVIEVFGSSSARVGSKAIFDGAGKNLVGWVGEGCAEQHVAEQSIAVLSENRARIIEADLDDELYGLGVACGGKMNLFLEPVLPSEVVELETSFLREAVFLGKRYGWTVNAHPVSVSVSVSVSETATLKSLMIQMVKAIAKKRGLTGKSLRDLKNVPITYLNTLKPSSSKRVIVVGSTRITDSLTEHFQMLGFEVHCVGPLLTPYGQETGPKIQFQSGDRVIIASHTSQDTAIVAKALKADIAYVAMVGSRKRALEVMKILNLEEGARFSRPLYVPAGFEIDAKNPEEVALSIVAECVSVT